ncbi:DHA2 family efflux MFS transporter permease subunit [soil metagenome]
MPKKRVVHKSYVLLIIAVAQFMVVLDTSIVNVALPSIYKALDFGTASSLQWVVTAYTLAFGGFLLLGGRAADLYGRRKVFLYAVAAFSIVSLLCGLAQSSLMIEITRAVQGLAAAFMSPAALSIIITTFKEGKERAKALSVWGAVAAGGAAAGVLLGGVLTQYLDWRWNFFVNIPVGIAVFTAAWLYVPESKADLDHKKLDLPGAVSVTSGLILLVYAITQAPTKGWLSTETLSFFAVSVALLAYFIYNEARSKHALMPLNIFKVGTIAGANITQVPITAAMFSMFFFVSLYIQQVLGYSPVKTGLGFLPITVVIGTIASQMPRVIHRFGYKKPLVVAPLLMAGGLFYLSNIRVDGTYWVDVFPGLFLMALGMGIMFISITIAATSGVPARESGLASGILNTSQQLGGAIGLAILSGVSTAAVTNYMSTHAATAQSQLTIASAQVHGFHNALLVGAGFTVLASLSAAFLIKHHDAPDDIEAAIHV